MTRCARSHLVVAVLMLALSSRAAAQTNTWSSLGPFGGSILSLASEPSNANVVYAVAERVGVFKSVDGGQSWTLITGSLSANAQFRSVAVARSNPQTIYAGSFAAGIYKSTDAGLSWSPLTAFSKLPPPHAARYVPVESVSIDPADANIVYATASGNGEAGVWRSLDGGATWAKTSLGLNSAPISGVVVDPSATATIYAYGGGGVFKSSNRGGVWVSMNSGRETNTGFPYDALSLAIDPASPSVLYAGYAYGVHKSTNGAQDWVEISTGLPAQTGSGVLVTALAVNEFNPAEILAGIGCDGTPAQCGLVYRTVDGGQSWTLRSTGLDMPPPMPPSQDFGARVRALLALSATTFVAGTACRLEDAQPGPCSLGLHRTTDAGANWSGAISGLLGVIASSIVTSDGNDMLLGTFGWGVYRSTNAGVNWSRVNSGLGGALTIYQLARDPTNAAVLYAATNDGVYLSSDAGVNWSRRSTGITGPTQLIIRSVAVDPITPQVIFAASANGLWVSTNSGLSWIPATVPFPEPYACYSVLASPRAGSSAVLAACTRVTGRREFRGHILRSVDGGANFSSHSLVAGAINIDHPVSLAIVDPDGLVYGAGTLATYVSQDGGQTWARRDAGLPRTFQLLKEGTETEPPVHDFLLEETLVRPIRTHPSNSTRAWTGWAQETFATQPTGPFVTTDQGHHWTTLGFGLPNVGIRDLAPVPTQPSVLLAATNGGVWRLQQAAEAPPALTAIAPSRAWRLTTARVTATGSGLTPESQLFVLGLPARNVVVTGSTSIAGDVGPYPPTDNPDAPDAVGDVFVANPDGQISVLANAFRFTTGCPLTFTPPGFTFNPAAAGGSIGVSAPAGCPWTASAPSWVTITGGSPANGDGTVRFTVAAHTESQSRSGTIGFGGTASVTIFQTGTNPTCSYTLATTSVSMSAAGGPSSVGVTTSGGCAWTAVSNAPWITVTSTGAGNGTATVAFAVAANTGAPRTGTLTIAAQTVTVSQAATEPTSDADGDGLPDAWEGFFRLDPLSPVGDNGAAGDPDGDGQTNLQEYQASTHPRGFFTRYLAEGALNAFFDVRLALVNVGTADAQLWIRYLQSGGATVASGESLPILRRRTIGRTELSSLTSPEFSTVVESDQPFVLDRTMSWDSRGYGSHAESGIPSPATTWYLAEGSTSGDFALFYLIQNPNPTSTTATVRYLRPFGEPPIERTYALAPSSRTTIPVDAEGPELASTDVSAVIMCPLPVIVERAMYISRPSQVFAAGHGSAGVTAPATSWFLAEGATGPFFDLFILLANPNAQAATVGIDYLLSDGRTFTKSYAVPANGRVTVWVDDEEIPAGSVQKPLDNVAVSSTITSTNGVPIVVERAMWWPSPAMTSDFWTEAHNSPGATATGTRWALAEGEVGGPAGAETYVLVANTSSFGGEARVTLFFEDGGTVNRTFPLAPRSRTSVSVSAEFPAAAGRRFATLIESLGATPAQIVVERAMYTSPGGVTWAAGTNALATRLP